MLYEMFVFVSQRKKKKKKKKKWFEYNKITYKFLGKFVRKVVFKFL